MDTLEFFQTVLPEDSIHYLVLFTKKLDERGNPFKIHKPFSDLETMAAAMAEFDNDEQYVGVYHACAGYLKPFIELEELNKWGKPKRQFRVGDNWHQAKAFWVDIDCGQEKFDKGEGYLTKRDACTALYKFADTIAWPRPMVVDSGNGIHAYWPLEEEIDYGTWVRTAVKLKATAAHLGLIADPTRTADFASILRPAGSFNRKHGGCKEVVVKARGTVSDYGALATSLSEFMLEHDVVLVHEPKKRFDPNLNSDLTAHLPQYPDLPVDANMVADKCAQVGAMRDTQGDVSYEHWRRVIGILVHCVDGRTLAEDWSSRREETGHDQIDWDIKYDTWSTGPSLCSAFEACNPSGCEGCPMKGKVSTPLALGRTMPENEATVEEVVTEEGTTVETEIPALLHGYTWSNNIMARLLPDKEGVLQPHPFSSVLFYPTSRIRTEEGTYRIGIRMHMPNHKVRDFDIPTEAMASQTDMLRSMAKYELLQSNHKDAGSHMSAYLRDQLEQLKRTVEEINTLTTYGWRDDMSGFLLGDRLYHKDGTVRKVLTGGGAGKFRNSLPEPKGTIAKYASAINGMYNREGMEHWQYAICSGWGSVLSPFGEDLYRGLLVALHGGNTGKGKTTACYASLYAFGDADALALKSDDGFTQNALWAYLGTYNNVPVLLDEMTNMDGPSLSRAAYGVSTGKEKVRLTSKGGQVGFATTHTWCMSPFVTGNIDFHGLLASHQANSQAEAVRLIQISVDRYPRVQLGETEQEETELVHQSVDTMKANMGVAGDAMLKHIVTHQRQMADAVRDAMIDLAKHLPGPKYRFYRNHAACTLTAAKLAKDLGIIDFDLERLKAFTIEMLGELAESVTESNTVTTEDAFSRMVGELQGRIIVTTELRDGRSKAIIPETPRRPITGKVAGRYVLGSPNDRKHTGHLYICLKEAKAWCMANRVDFNAILKELDMKGALLKKREKIALTRGTDMTPVQSWSFLVDTKQLEANNLTLVSTTSGDDVAQAVGDEV